MQRRLGGAWELARGVCLSVGVNAVDSNGSAMQTLGFATLTPAYRAHQDDQVSVPRATRGEFTMRRIGALIGSHCHACFDFLAPQHRLHRRTAGMRPCQP